MKPGKIAIISVIILLVLGIGVTGAWLQSRDKTAKEAPAAMPLVTARESAPGRDYSEDTDLQTVATVKLSEAPQDLREAVRQEWRTKASKCVQGNAVTDTAGKIYDPEVRYVANGFAMAEITCSDKLTMLAARSDAGWDKVDTTKTHFSCEQLQYYKVPSAFLQKLSADKEAKIKCLPADSKAAPVDYAY